MRIVVDASAVIDGSSPANEEWFAAWSEVLDAAPLLAPALLAWEIGNVVHGRGGARFGRDEASRATAVETMLEGIELVGTDEPTRQACGTVARKLALTFYDASYLELAVREDDRLLLTQDAALLAAGRKALGAKRAFDLDGISAGLAEIEAS